MGLLKDKTIYLSGPIEASADAVSWRDRIKADLSWMGARCWDPLVKPTWLHEYAYVDGPEQGKWKGKVVNTHPSLSEQEELKKIKDANSQIRSVCLRLAAACDIMICRMTGEFTAGTFEELAVAQGKPILFWSNKIIPSMWMFDQFGSTDKWEDVFFDNWDDLHEYIRKVDTSEISVDPMKWVFLTWEKR